MKRLATTVSLLALTASLAACSGSKTADGSSSKPTPTPTKATVVTEAQAKAALPVAADLGAGFKADEYSHEDLPGGCPAVEAAIKADQALHPTFVGASFSKDDSGYTVDGEIGVYPTAVDATAVFNAYVTAFGTCPTWTVNQDGFTGTIGLKVQSTPQLGDMATELALSGEGGGQKFAGIQYVIVVGNTLVFASESGPEGNTDDPKVDLPGISAAIVGKLQAA